MLCNILICQLPARNCSICLLQNKSSLSRKSEGEPETNPFSHGNIFMNCCSVLCAPMPPRWAPSHIHAYTESNTMLKRVSDMLHISVQAFRYTVCPLMTYTVQLRCYMLWTLIKCTSGDVHFIVPCFWTLSCLRSERFTNCSFPILKKRCLSLIILWLVTVWLTDEASCLKTHLCRQPPGTSSCPHSPLRTR